MFGGEGNALGLPGIDRQRIQPEWLPAVIEPVQQPEMMSMEVEDRWDIATIGQRQDHGAPGLGAKRGGSGACEVGGRHPVGLRAANGQIDPQGVLEIEPRR
jgi:hypothetical protein